MDLSPFWSAVKSAVAAQLVGNTSPDEVEVKAALEIVLPAMAEIFRIPVDDALNDAALKTMLARIAVNMQTGTALIDRIPHQPWVETRNLEWGCWDAYEGYVLEKGFPGAVVRAIRDDTHRILDLLGDPLVSNDWDRRGLVLGHVQSGKTSNYSGVISRAADAGYKLFIIIAGIHENLRNQTQHRIDEAFIRLAPPTRRPISLTTPEDDFSRIRAEQRIPPQGVGTSLVLVVKKNTIILNNLLNWLKDNSGPGSDWADMPLLLVDDEADNASINTNKPENDPTRINGLIRSILNIFKKSSYVGYTATPFANIFIDPEQNDVMAGQDLFPRNFIYCIEAPSNYIGPESIFLDEDNFFLRVIDDAVSILPRSHKSSFSPNYIPDTLSEAIKLFLLACTIRAQQGVGNSHMSMLVNVSPYAAVQLNVRRLIDEELVRLRNIITNSALMTKQYTDFWIELQDLFVREYADCGIPWNDIRSAMPDAIQTIKTFTINSKSGDRLNYLDYKNIGLKVIAVGGYTLSRGLTLENLVVSYWNRNSKSYDTLMQMGRWFGYRDDYESLCRVWMPYDAQGWYAHIAEASLELRADLLDMSRRGMTPEDFGLKVRNHPETLVITARNKMRSGETRTVRPDLSKRLIETHVICREMSILETNRNALKRLIQSNLSLSEGEKLRGEKGSHLWRSIPHENVKNFFHEYRAHLSLLHADHDYLFAWLDALEEAIKRKGGKFTWDVLLVSIPTAEEEQRCNLEGIDIGKQVRTVGGRILREPGKPPIFLPYDPDLEDIKDAWRIGNKQRVASRGIEKAPLSKEEIDAAALESRLAGEKNVPDHRFRGKLKRPLLMLHVIDIYRDAKERSEPPLCKDAVAWGASFPDCSNLSIQARDYTVNKVWLEQFGPSAEIEEEED